MGGGTDRVEPERQLRGINVLLPELLTVVDVVPEQLVQRPRVQGFCRGLVGDEVVLAQPL